ncbi:MAG: elongation factor Ts, partial [Planctomycetota bacterium]|nr:elongation factor Ts [Planctomycetota bacterium]
MSTANISAKDVMALRQKTGLGMMDCKKALVEAEGDIAAAEANLREKLKGKMDERTDRAAGEGCIAIQTGSGTAAIIEVRAETDFTARNEMFVNMANEAASMAL